MTSEPMSGVGDRSGGDGCLRCGAVLESMGFEKFRIGGTGGGWKLLFGELAELGEEMIPLELFGCRRCRHVEFRLPVSG